MVDGGSASGSMRSNRDFEVISDYVFAPCAAVWITNEHEKARLIRPGFLRILR
jgi:hypothetical protein